MMRGVVLFLAVFATIASSLKRYDGYSTRRCFFENDEQKELVYSMSRVLNVEVIGKFVDSADLFVSKEHAPVFDALKCNILVEDAQKQMELEDKRLEVTRNLYAALNDTDSYHKAYHTLDEIYQKVNEIVSLYPRVATQKSMGRSLEGRNLPVVHLSGSTTSKPKVFLMSGLHAREWIGPATAVYILQILAEKYGVDSRITTLLNTVEIVIAPISNPDGYLFSWTDDRMWRKNRNDNAGNSCKGVDLNRNFDVFWGTGSSNTKCAQDYHGTGAASEPEVANIQKYVSSLSNLIGAIDVHSYGQYLMRPYGYTTAKHPDESILSVLGSEMATIVRQTTGASYSSIRSAELYPVSGASDDWFTVELDIWGFCFELRDKGLYGFRLPESNILPTGQEIYAAFVHYVEFVNENFKK